MATNFAEAVPEGEDTAPEETEEVETVESEEAEPVAEDETEETEEETSDAEEPEAWEFDAGGTKLLVDKGQLPEDVAQKVDAFLKTSWANVTQKSQNIAEERKAVEQRAEALETISMLQKDVMDTYSRGMQARNELERLGAVNIDELWQSDPDQARQITDRMTRLNAEWQSAIGEVSQKETEFLKAQEAERGRLIDQGKTTMDARIKNFSTEKAPEVIDYVVSTYGLERESTERDWPLNPATAEMAYKAMLYDKAQAKLTKPRKSEPPRPMRKVSSGTSRATHSVAAKSPESDRMSTDEWMRKRNAELRRKGR